MKITIISLFPDLYSSFMNHSIIKRAIQKQAVSIDVVDLRSYGMGPHKQVDDTPFGGGSGMVLMAPVVVAAIKDVCTPESKIVLLSPQGATFNQSMAMDLARDQHLILICGHYEGFDERIRDYIDLEISIGDYVLTGGEIPAMLIADSVIRLIPNVINPNSLTAESFHNHLLDYPVYTKPVLFDGKAVPPVLLSGHHANINQWRSQQAELKTKIKRPDLWAKFKKGIQ